MVFKDTKEKEVLIWKHISSETVKEYKDLKQQLEKIGYTIKSVTFDGKRGLPKLFKDYPVQMCHFHQKNYEFVFISSQKKPFYSHDIINLRLKKILKVNTIQVRKLYNLRHTFASQLIAAGEDIT